MFAIAFAAIMFMNGPPCIPGKTDLSNFFPTPIDTNHWYKLVAELDLTNKVVQYWVDGVNNYFSFDTINNIPHSSLQLPNSDPDVPYFYSQIKL